MSGREDIESSPTVNKVLPRNVRTNPVGGGAHDAPVWRNSNFVGGHSICPRCMEFHSNTRRRTPEPALCKGRCRAERGTGVVPYTNYLSFLQTFSFYNPSGALAPAPFAQGGLFWFVRTLQADLRGVMRLWRCAPAPYRVCANIAGTYLAHP